MITATRILLVDDQPVIRTGFRLILEAEPDLIVVGESGDGLAAVADARSLQPDVVLMDIRMPRLDGVKATYRILEAPSATRVIILTTFDLDAHVLDALRAGASGFLVKDGPADSLVEAIRAIVSGEAVISPQVTRRLLERFAALPEPAPAPPSLNALTQRETDVLRALSRGLSNAEIAAELFISESTVKTHVAHILDKYHLRDRVQAVILAYDTGLALPSTSPGRGHSTGQETARPRSSMRMTSAIATRADARTRRQVQAGCSQRPPPPLAVASAACDRRPESH